MKRLKYQMFKRIIEILNIEITKLKCKFIFYNCKLPFDLRQAAYIELYKLCVRKFVTMLRNRCLLNFRSRVVLVFFKLSRIQVKYLLYNNMLVGVKKRSF